MADTNNLSTLAKRLRPLMFYTNSRSYITEDPTNGLRMVNAIGAKTVKFQLEDDGDIFIGEDVSAPGTTFLSIFVNAQNYNNETVGAGDVLLGDNSTDKANILWDRSEGRLKFRGGPDPKSFIDTDGGFVILTGTAYNRVNATSFNNGAADVGDLSGYNIEGAHGIGLRSRPIADHQSNLEILSEAPSTSIGYIYLRAFNASHESRLTLSGGSSAGAIQMTSDSVTLLGDTTACHFQFDGDLKAYRNSQYFAGYIFVPLTTPLTSISWDGDSYSTTAKTLIDLSAVFGAPAGVKAVLARVEIRDSGSSGFDAYLFLSPVDTAGVGLMESCAGLGNDYRSRGTHIVPCDANGDIYYQINASGSLTMDVKIEIWGYFI